MGADQQFCLRWNNFHTNITSAFESLRDDEDFVDITLACEGRQVKAHKMVLSACSPYFRSLLKGNPCQHPIVFLKDVTFANLASILDFMYHGEVNVSHNELATFLKTAEALKVRGLAEDDKKKDSDGYVESNSPGPTRDPPDPGSPRPDETSATDTHLSDSPPPYKKQRRRSGTSVQSAEDTNETVISEIRETSVKNEPQEFNDDEDMLGHSGVETGDIKTDNSVSEENDERNNFGISESVTISRSQAAMQQLQESFGSFLPTISQSSGFLPHGATDMPRPPFPLEGVQGLPPGISALPGPSMSQAGASQDTSQGEGDKEHLDCTFCGKNCSSRYNLKKHVRDIHLNKGTKFTCGQCNRTYSSLNSLQVHRSVTHPTGNRRRHSQGGSGRRRSGGGSKTQEEILLDEDLSQEPSEEVQVLEEKRHKQAPHQLLSHTQHMLQHPLMDAQGKGEVLRQHNSPHEQRPHVHGMHSPPPKGNSTKADMMMMGVLKSSLSSQGHLPQHHSTPAHHHHQQQQHSHKGLPPSRQTSHEGMLPSPIHSNLSPQLHTPNSPLTHNTPISPQQPHTPTIPSHSVHSPYLQTHSSHSPSPQMHASPSPQMHASPSPQMHASPSPQMHLPHSPQMHLSHSSLNQKSPSSKNYDLHGHTMTPPSLHHGQMHYGMQQQHQQQQHSFSPSSSVAMSSFHPMDSGRHGNSQRGDSDDSLVGCLSRDSF